MVATMAIATLLGVPVGLALGQAAASLPGRLGLPGRLVRGGVALLTAVLLIAATLPLILHAAAWETTLGRFGIFSGERLGGWLRGDGRLLWVAWVHSSQGGAIVALAALNVRRRVGATIGSPARLDASPIDRWLRVWLPVAGAPMFLAVVVIGLLAATDMTVADLYAVRTVADQFYLFHSVNPSVTAIASITLLPAALGWLPWWLLRRTRWPRGYGRAGEPAARDGSGAAGFGSIAMLVAGGALFVLPTAGVVLQIDQSSPPGATWVDRAASVAAVVAAAPWTFAVELRWTLSLTLAIGITAFAPAAVLVILVDRHRRFTGGVHALGIACYLVPGPLVGAAVATAFSGADRTLTMLATQTLVPTILACLPKSIVVAYAVLAMAVARLDPATRQSARLDRGPAGRLASAHGPVLLPWIVASIGLAGWVGGNDVAAQLPVLPPGVVTVGTRLFALLHSGARYQEATLMLAQSLVLVLGGVIGWRVWRWGAIVPRPRGLTPFGWRG